MEILWTEEAKLSFDEITKRILKKFSQKKVDSFILDSFSTIYLLTSFPKMFPKSSLKKHKSARKGILHPNTSMYYKISKKTLVILLFVDNRSNPLNS